MDDLISRAAALDALGECQMIWTDDNDYVLGARNQYDMDRLAIETVPSAQQWIPVAEGLPDKYEYVLLTCERNGNLVTDFGCLSPDIDGDTSWWIAAHDLIEGWRVLAWCPLPEPWKGGEK